MTKYVNGLTYAPTADNADYVGKVDCDAGSDNSWIISPAGSVDGNPNNINPSFLIIDNIANNAIVETAFGPYAWIVPAFARKTFRLPQGTQTVSIGVTVGTVSVYFVQNPNFAPDDTNMFAIQQAAAGALVFPFITYLALNSPQQASDAAMTVELVPTGATVNYILLPIATSVKNGWFQFVSNVGTRVANLIPNGGDTLNSFFNAGTPFQLYPNELGILQSDGAQWFFRIIDKARPTISTAAANTNQTPNDVGKRFTFGLGANQAYSLLPAADFRPGDSIRIKVTGTGRLSIVPNGAELINGLFANASPLMLSTKDSGELFIDDSGAWAYDGDVSYESPEFPFGSGLHGSYQHGFGGKPRKVELYVRCKVAELNYAVDDEILIGVAQSTSSDPTGMHAVTWDTQNIYYAVTQRNALRLSNKTNGTDTNPAQVGNTLTNFNGFLRANARI